MNIRFHSSFEPKVQNQYNGSHRDSTRIYTQNTNPSCVCRTNGITRPPRDPAEPRNVSTSVEHLIIHPLDTSCKGPPRYRPSFNIATMDLGPTWGVWIISVWLETILYGMGVLQTWLYFLWYPKDHWGVKLAVLLILFFETLQVALWMAATYDPLINHFGNLDALYVLDWKDWGTLVSGYICAFIVQLYFAHCIFNLNRRKPTFAVLILALAVLQMGAGVAGTVQVSRLGNFLNLGGAKTANSLQSAASAVCDIVITVALTVLLRGNNSNMESTNMMMHKISIYAINRGALTAIAAVLNLILFLASPDTFYFFFGLLLSSKLYMNSMLGVLNTRQYIRNSVQKQGTRNGPSIFLDALSSSSSGRRTSPNPGVLVNTITTVDFDDPTSPSSQKTDKFTPDIV